ncbi:penicillin-binding protein 1A [Peptostreptococcaceae bacterium pGA-8]|nr:penicillin-binding protein 1A [Peptostreptococcaceae bacterium pGA-8]
MKSIKKQKGAPPKTKAGSSIKAMSLKKKVLLSVLSLIFALVLAAVAYTAIVIHQAPKINTDDIYKILSESTVLYDDEGNEIDRIYEGASRTSVKYEDLPDDLKNAFVALEDKTFWNHHGFNLIRMFGAIKDSLFNNSRVSGTSTITQQLARNLFLKEDMSKRTLRRKIVEAYYTVILERKLSKKEILTTYLNTIYLGNNASGVQAAAQAYFSKDVSELNLVECAALATIPQSPSTYALVQLVEQGAVDPNSENVLKKTPQGIYVINDITKNRRETCLKLMKEQNYITKKQYDEAKAIPLRSFINPSYETDHSNGTYFTDYAIENVIKDLMAKENLDYQTAWDQVYKGGLKIYSTMDAQAQGVIEKEFANDNNFPDAVDIAFDRNKNIMTSSGKIMLYNVDNMIDENGIMTLSADEAVKNNDGSIIIYADKRINLYDTKVHGKNDVSVEMKPMYTYIDGQLYAINGGFINIPQNFKKKDNDGNLVISKEFIKNYPDFFTFNDDGTININPTSYKLEQQIIQPQAAMTIIDNSTGELKAMVGGRNTVGQKLHNRATSPRQPGSAIKPLTVYGAAIQQSVEEVAAGKRHTYSNFNIDKQGDKYWGDYITASSPVIDEKTTIDGRVWPTNATNTYSGKQTLRTAMEQSLNTCAVKVLLQIGQNYGADMLEKFGITTLVREGASNDMNPAAIALGGMNTGISPLEIASAYTAFPNGGVRKDVSSYSNVLDRNGKEILTSKESEAHKVIDPGTAFIMTSMLKSVVSHGICPTAATRGVAAGGKSGTTTNKFDSWFVGFTPKYTASLWMGNDVNLAMSGYGNRATDLWGVIMNQIPKALQGSYPSAPSNVTSVNGEYYIVGTEKNLGKYSGKLKKVMICEDTGFLATPDCPNQIEKEFDEDDEEEAKKIPTYYCHKHNPDPKQFPIDPEMKLETPEKPDEDPDNKPDPAPTPRSHLKPWLNLIGNEIRLAISRNI